MMREIPEIRTFKHYVSGIQGVRWKKKHLLQRREDQKHLAGPKDHDFQSSSEDQD